MPRPRKSDRPIAQRVYLPESLVAEMTMLLWSEAEGRVPYGAFSSFIEQCVREALAHRKSGSIHVHQS